MTITTEPVRAAEMTAKVVVVGIEGSDPGRLLDVVCDRGALPVDGIAAPGHALRSGRLAIAPELALMLITLPTDRRHRDSWATLATGALGALVVLGPDEIVAGAAVVDRLAFAGLPFVVLVDSGDRAVPAGATGVRDGLELDRDDQVIVADLSDRRAAQYAVAAAADHFFA